jgi:hypothetical protein
MNPNIGKPGMVGVGPGQNLRKKTFAGLQQDFKKVFDFLQSHRTPDKMSIKGFTDHLQALKRDVDKYCANVPGTEEFHACYVRALAGLETLRKAYDQTDQHKLDDTIKAEVPKLVRQLAYMVHANYLEPQPH